MKNNVKKPNFNFGNDQPLKAETNRIMQKLKRRSKEPFVVPDKSLKPKQPKINKIISNDNAVQKPKQQTTRGVTLKMVKEQFGHDQDIKFLWRNVLPKSMPVMLCGREGSAKTTNALQMAK